MPSWGILQDPKHPYVPGTIKLNEDVSAEKLADWEYQEPKKRGDTILNPQPSDSPNDPLNWPTSTKLAILVILSFASGVTVSLGPMLTPGMEDIAKKFNVTTDQASFNLVGLLLAATGGALCFTAAAAAVWGKRPVFFLSTLCLFATSTWGFFSPNLLSLTASRFIQGVAAAPLDTLIGATVSELFFVHEKGRMLSIWNMFVMGGPKLGPLVSGFIIQNLGFEFTFGICALLYFVIAVLMYFLLLETVFVEKEPVTEVIFDKSSLRIYEIIIPEKKKSYSERLKIFQGRVSKNASFWRLSFKPFPLILFPVVIYAAITFSTYAASITLVALLQDTIFSEAPYNLTVSQIGLTNVPLFAIGLVGTLLSGYAADGIVQFMTRKNNGVCEPEFRLVLMLIAATLSTTAYLGVGYSVSAGAHISIPIVFLGLHTAAVPFANSAMFTYVMDCHSQHAPQAFVTMGLAKGLMALGLSNFVNGWYDKSGPKAVFTIVAIVSLAVSLMSLPMYIFGKRLRSKIARSSFHQGI
ncbi:uncharacterized protein L3040_007289 [Drepanopeziza brunnea f. sp. 'multigermtubi']|uniref:MFS transporter n=1 Tax=Marssonina brunnea f. sp. multigermtubi (strain MB_m1) TaxID=1072389 RepID=K1XHP1_MARBU|nr:MFS transporter [Drepanopeziza brunnea f. sp. 'multigermtubi' MB_m1]EKD20278.1 MFS transporter [Drepanopeziza brunnea f. sp. 'multigermtubi' MB_m1]KAJ5038427.1 hypothetical protein L3040_007289 [Drepanopeziza brunnea f. sp. 'multigermtubi']